MTKDPLDGFDPANVVTSITIEIDAPASIVWQVLTDFPAYGAWNPFCVQCKATLEIGSPVEMMLTNYWNPGELTPNVEYICAIEPERQLSWEMTYIEAWPYPARRDQYVTALGAERSSYYSTDAFLGEYGIHVTRFAGPWVKASFDATARALKKRAEEIYAKAKAA